MRSKCLVCGASLHGEKLMSFGNMPKAAQHFPDADELSKDKTIGYNLMQCSGCGLVQLDVDAIDYYRDVIRSGGHSTTMQALRHEQYERFMQLCPISGKRIIEVGCGQGEFLRIWREDGFPVDAYGIEHDPKLVEIARADRLNVWQGFTEEIGTVIENGPFDGFCSFNFLEHQPNPNIMLRCIYNNLKTEAYGLITVPSLEYIIREQSYYEFIRDHLVYFSRDTFCFTLELNGFHVLSCREVNRDTWEAIVEKKPVLDTSAMRENRENLKQEIDSLINDLKSRGERLAVWGASHQGLTILSSMQLENEVPYVIDSAPFKQGRYTIGSHLLIVPFEHVRKDPVQAILIIAPGYTDEIAGIIRREYGDEILIYVLRSNRLERYE